MLTGYFTPWGECDYCVEIVPGVYCCCTPSHGGIVVMGEQTKKLSSYARKIADRQCMFGEIGYWFEEDCGWAIPIFELELYEQNARSYGYDYQKCAPRMTAERMKQLVMDCLREWHNEYYVKNVQA